MNKIAVIYASVHHGNTRKLVQEISKEISMDCYSVEEAKNKDLSSYELIGIASGLYFGKMHKSMLDYLAGKPTLGAFVCKGFDTYGPFKLIGGINKNHPDEADVKQAIDFVGKL